MGRMPGTDGAGAPHVDSAPPKGPAGDMPQLRWLPGTRMDNSNRQELKSVIAQLVVKSGSALNGDLRDDTSLVQSGLIESMAVLELAECISGLLGGPVDLTNTDISREWDSIDGIMAFLDRNR